MNQSSINRQTVSGFIFLFILLIAAVLWIMQQRTVIKNYVIGNTRIRLEVTQTAEDRTRGLGGRDTVGKADGLLFVFPETDRHGIWMKDMRFDIDIVWVGDGKIVDIAPNVPYVVKESFPARQTTQELPIYYPRLDANMVIEFPAGFVAAHGWKIGDTVAAAVRP